MCNNICLDYVNKWRSARLCSGTYFELLQFIMFTRLEMIQPFIRLTFSPFLMEADGFRRSLKLVIWQVTCKQNLQIRRVIQIAYCFLILISPENGVIKNPFCPQGLTANEDGTSKRHQLLVYFTIFNEELLCLPMTTLLWTSHQHLSCVVTILEYTHNEEVPHACYVSHSVNVLRFTGGTYLNVELLRNSTHTSSYIHTYDTPACTCKITKQTPP